MKRILKYSSLLIILISGSLYADYSKALDLFMQGKNQESLQAIAAELDAAKDMVKDSPNYKLRFLAAHNHWMMKNYEGAISHFTRCQSIKPESSDPLIDLGLMYIEMKKFPIALTYSQKIIEKDPKNSMGYYINGKAKSGMGNFWGAKEILEKALAIDSELYQGWNELGNVLVKLNKLSDAEIAYQTALALNSNSPEILNNLAVCYHKSGDAKKAADFAKRALEASKNNPVIAKNAGLITK